MTAQSHIPESRLLDPQPDNSSGRGRIEMVPVRILTHDQRKASSAIFHPKRLCVNWKE